MDTQTIGYVIVLRPDGKRAIRCLKCKCTSWHPLDVYYRFCAGCHGFYEWRWAQL